MPRIRRWMIAPRLSVALLGAGALFVSGSGIAEASYGPPPPPIAVPGGYLTVVTSQTVGPGGGTIGPVSGGNTETTAVVPRGAFLTPLKVTITEPDVSAIGNAGFCGYQAVAGIGVIIQNPDGSVNNSFFTNPLVVTISSPAIQPGDIIVVWNGDKFVRVGVAEDGDSVTVKLTHAGYNFFAVLHPVGSEVDPCATSGGIGSGIGSGFSLATFGEPGLAEAFFTAMFGMTADRPLAGLGVLAARFTRHVPAFARSFSFRSRGLRGRLQAPPDTSR